MLYIAVAEKFPSFGGVPVGRGGSPVVPLCQHIKPQKFATPICGRAWKGISGGLKQASIIDILIPNKIHEKCHLAM